MKSMKRAVRRIAPRDHRMRAAYRERRRAQLQEWSARLDLWQARARKTKAGVKVSYREQLEDLRNAVDSVRDRIVEVERAGEGAWGELKEGVGAAAAEARQITGRVSRRLDR